MSWLEHIEFKDLIRDSPYLMLIEDNKPGDINLDLDTISQLAVKGGLVIVASAGEHKKQSDNRPPKSLWISVRIEMLEFLCGNDPKYDKLREQLEQVKKGGSKTIIPLIAAAIAGFLNVGVGMITGLVALIIGVILKTGKVGFCNYYYKK